MKQVIILTVYILFIGFICVGMPFIHRYYQVNDSLLVLLLIITGGYLSPFLVFQTSREKEEKLNKKVKLKDIVLLFFIIPVSILILFLISKIPEELSDTLMPFAPIILFVMWLWYSFEAYKRIKKQAG